jgi:hypothetical protein
MPELFFTQRRLSGSFDRCVMLRAALGEWTWERLADHVLGRPWPLLPWHLDELDAACAAADRLAGNALLFGYDQEADRYLHASAVLTRAYRCAAGHA